MTFAQTFRRIAAVALVSVCALSWVTLGLTVLLDGPNALLVTAVIAAAVSTEALFWVGGALLGWTAFANRARLWKQLTGSV